MNGNELYEHQAEALRRYLAGVPDADRSLVSPDAYTHDDAFLAHAGNEVELEVAGPVTQRSVLDALEARYPVLRGTIRDQTTRQRRAFRRFFACQEDISHQPADAPLPGAVVSGQEPLLIIGAIAGG